MLLFQRTKENSLFVINYYEYMAYSRIKMCVYFALQIEAQEKESKKAKGTKICVHDKE